MRPDLHERIAVALGWTPEQAQSFSLPTLRELVRVVDVALAREITEFMQTDRYIATPLPPRRRRW